MPSAERAQVELAEIEDLQVLLYRNGAWAAPLPRPVDAQPNPNSPIPDGVRLLLTLTSTYPLSGAITQDWVRPTLGGGKS